MGFCTECHKSEPEEERGCVINVRVCYGVCRVCSRARWVTTLLLHRRIKVISENFNRVSIPTSILFRSKKVLQCWFI